MDQQDQNKDQFQDQNDLNSLLENLRKLNFDLHLKALTKLVKDLLKEGEKLKNALNSLGDVGGDEQKKLKQQNLKKKLSQNQNQNEMQLLNAMQNRIDLINELNNNSKDAVLRERVLKRLSQNWVEINDLNKYLYIDDKKFIIRDRDVINFIEALGINMKDMGPGG